MTFDQRQPRPPGFEDEARRAVADTAASQWASITASLIRFTGD